MKKHKSKSWVDKKLANPKFKKGFESEYDKLAIGEQLARLRKQANLTQAQIAKKIGTTASAISRYENADYNRHELATLHKIAKACGGALRLVFVGPRNHQAA